MTIFATCEEQIKLNEHVIAQSISICLAEVYISIPVHTKLQTVRKNHQLLEH